jgi:two-component system, NtrC family, sensor histidine kinase HydH
MNSSASAEFIPSLSKRLAWVNSFRLGMLFLILLFLGGLYLKALGVLGDYSTKVALATLAFGFALTALTLFWLRGRRDVVWLVYAQLISDQMMWTILAYVTGGINSVATTLYGLTTVTAAVLIGLRGVIVSAISAATLMIFLTASLVSKWIFPPIDQRAGTYALSWNQSSYPLSVNLLALVVVAVLAGYLSERLRTAGGAVQLANERAEAAERLAILGKFSAALAHEIRNPLGSISGCIDLLAQSHGLDEEELLLCGIISRETVRLNELVTDMLDLAKPRVPEISKVALGKLARDLVALASHSGRGQDVIVVLDGPQDEIFVHADPSQLRQIIWNLVRNAVQASSAGTQVTVRLARDERGVNFEVHDLGVGIPDSARSQLFDAFYTSRSHGVGIGLAVVKRIVDDHGWEIEVESAEGKGTTFRVLLGTSVLDSKAATF